jgi:hypothetical protein
MKEKFKITKQVIKKRRQERNKEGEKDNGRHKKKENQVRMPRRQ